MDLFPVLKGTAVIVTRIDGCYRTIHGKMFPIITDGMATGSGNMPVISGRTPLPVRDLGKSAMTMTGDWKKMYL
jgi:hypothetical protein